MPNMIRYHTVFSESFVLLEFDYAFLSFFSKITIYFEGDVAIDNLLSFFFGLCFFWQDNDGIKPEKV